VVNLAAAGDRAPSARMFWDQAANAWTFVAHDLPAPATGRTYQLWVIARQAGVTSYVSAGTFAPGPNGSAVVRATYPLAPNALSAIGVTDEPAGGVPQPTGRLVLVGNAE
jgi:anti-sigma-K factor RskA